MREVSLFSGVGGLDLAGHWAGIETVLFCEREPFAQKVLRKHWPDVPIIDDVHNVTREEIDRLGIGTIDLVSAGFPCQPFSAAGKRGGTDDERYLWPQVVRVLTELQPPWFIGENVAGLLSMAEPDGEPRVESRTLLLGEEEDLYEGIFTQQEKMLFGHICKDLEDIGYEVQPFVIPAAAVNAKNLRERIGILGYSERFRQSGKSRRRAGEKPENGHRGVESGVVADSASDGLSFGRRSGRNESNEEKRAGQDAGLERCGSLADSKSERFGEARRDSQRSEERTSGSGIVADTEGEPARGLSFGEDAPYTRPSICGENVADASGAGREEFDSSKITDRSGYGAGGCDAGRTRRPTQPGMGRDPNVFPAWLDGSGLNPLDALIEFIATYPQPALLGQAQHDWEPPRVAVGVKDRAPRLKALGNAVNPLQFYPIMYAIKVINDWLRRGRT